MKVSFRVDQMAVCCDGTGESLSVSLVPVESAR